MKKALFLGGLLAVLMLVLPRTVAAQRVVGCGCACGQHVLPEPCTAADCVAHMCGAPHYDQSYCPSEGTETGRGSSSFDGAAWRRQLVERGKRQLEKKRKDEEDKRQAAEANRNRQQEFEQQRARAVELLGRVSFTGSAPLPAGVGGNTSFFGVPGVNPEERELTRAQSTRTILPKAWQQLLCAASLSHVSNRRAKRAVSAADRQEVHYLNEQALKALSGETVEVVCDSQASGFPFQVSSSKPPSWENAPEVLALVEKQAEIMVRTSRELPVVERQVEAARKQVEEVKAEVEKLKEPAPPTFTLEEKTQREEEKKKKESALEEALQALKTAEEVKKKVEEERAMAKAKLDLVDDANKAMTSGRRGTTAEEAFAELMQEEQKPTEGAEKKKQ